MKIFTAPQIRAWDAYTILQEPIASIDLMERAAQKCTDWLMAQPFKERVFKIFCGKGNNGGDGLAIARMLFNQGMAVEVFILEFGRKGSEDFQINLQRLHEMPVEISFIQSADHFPFIEKTDILVDALFGSGLNKPLKELSAGLVAHINQSGAPVIAIDVPSGLFLDQSSRYQPVVRARYTLTFQSLKLALLMAENAPFIGEVQVLDIGLHKAFLEKEASPYQVIDEAIIKNIFRPRQRFAHKGTYGHALIMGGSYGKIGAAVLATKACLRTGAGLTSAFLPRCGYTIMQGALPEAMVMTDEQENFLTRLPEKLEKFTAVGMGPGMGTEEATQQTVRKIIQTVKNPLVLDADALNCLALYPTSLKQLPPYSILTPHPKEFERLFGKSTNEFEQLSRAMQQAKALQCLIVLKGHHTAIALPDGRLFFNATGNAGMAKGGSGDVLTGIITALLAQGYTPEQSALLGVYLHGLAGDLAAAAISKESMTATDIITFLSQAFVQLNRW